MRLAGNKGSRKAWIEFGTKESARSAREYDNTVSGVTALHSSVVAAVSCKAMLMLHDRL